MKEQDYLDKIKEAYTNYYQFCRQEFVKCYVCSRNSQRQRWTLEETITTEAECGYPVSYHTYFSYQIICPKCGIKSRLKDKPPKSSFFILKQINLK